MSNNINKVIPDLSTKNCGKCKYMEIKMIRNRSGYFCGLKGFQVNILSICDKFKAKEETK